MNIQEQAEAAKKITDELLKFIVKANLKKLNVDGKGCSISAIDIRYHPEETWINVTFETHEYNEDAPVSQFKCFSRLGWN